MLIGCPRCARTFKVNETRMDRSDMVLRCTSCGTMFRLPPLPPATTSVIRVRPEPEDTILVAHESPSFCAAVKTILAPQPWEVIICHDGNAALEQIAARGAQVALIDVALPGRYGFEVCEQLRANPATREIRILLFASIYDRTRYKRLPASLYGADDYIEKHHIPDLLVPKIRALLAGSAVRPTPADAEVLASGEPPDAAASPSHLEETRTLLRQEEEEATTSASAVTPLPDAQVKARRLARIIASDIALYNQEAVQEGVRSGTFFTLLAGDITEGRALYERRVSPEIRSATAYLEDAFSDLISKIKRELSL